MLKALRITNAVSGTLLCGFDLLGGTALHAAVPLGGNPAALGLSLAEMVTTRQCV